MVIDIHRSSDEGLNVRSPHTLQLADSVNSEFSPSGQRSDTRRETEDLVCTYYLPWVCQHLMAFDGDNTAAAQQPTNVLPELLRWLCFTGYGYDRITVR